MESREASGKLPRGFTSACKSAGVISQDGQWVTMTNQQWREIAFPKPKQSIALGDLVHKVAGPIGQAIHWPCNERDAKGNVTANLRPDSPCARARNLLNKVKL
jgi:hypothetical protein